MSTTTAPVPPLSVPPLFETPDSARTAGKWLEVLSHLDPQYGGITAAVPALGKAVLAHGIPTSAAAFCGPEETASPLWSHAPERFPASRLPWLLDSGLRSRLQSSIKRAEGVHIHGLWESHCAVAAGLSRRLGKPYVISAHGMLERWAMRNKGLKKRVYSALIENRNLRGAACLHALTAAEAEDYRRAGLRNPVAVVPNGIDLPGAVSPDEFLRQFPALKDRRLILFLSRIHFKKGLDILVEAWSRVERQYPEAQLVLAGPTSEGTREKVEGRIAELGIAHRVLFTGMLGGSMKWSALAAASVYVLPSYSEGFSVAVLEALAMGKPVVLTEQCNVPEIARAGCGWQIQPNSDDLERALSTALGSSEGELARMGAQGRELVEKQFTWDSCGARMAGVYRWIAGGVRPECVRIES